MAAILGGAVCTAAFKFAPALEAAGSFWGGPAIPSLVSAALAGVAVSLATPANTVTDDEALAILAAERRAMEMRAEREAGE